MNLVIGFGPSLGLALWPRAKPIKISLVMRYSRKSRLHCNVLSKLNTVNLDLSLANILNAWILLEWLYGIGNLVSMFQFKLSQ